MVCIAFVLGVLVILGVFIFSCPSSSTTTTPVQSENNQRLSVLRRTRRRFDVDERDYVILDYQVMKGDSDFDESVDTCRCEDKGDTLQFKTRDFEGVWGGKRRRRNLNSQTTITWCTKKSAPAKIDSGENWDPDTGSNAPPQNGVDGMLAVVCAPVFRTGKSRFNNHPDDILSLPPTDVVRVWVEHYIAAGFQWVYAYVHDPAHADPYKHIPNLSFFVIPWAEELGAFEGGQIYSMEHCLWTNRVHGTQWALFADVDEFLVDSNDRFHSEKLVDRILARVDNDERVHSFSFGNFVVERESTSSSARVMSVRSDDTPKSFLSRQPFPKMPTYGEETTCWEGHRKQLVSTQRACKINIHCSIWDPCLKRPLEDKSTSSSDGHLRVVDFKTSEFAMWHLRGLGSAH